MRTHSLDFRRCTILKADNDTTHDKNGYSPKTIVHQSVVFEWKRQLSQHHEKHDDGV